MTRPPSSARLTPSLSHPLQWTFTEDLTVIVGNATDILWTHSKGRITPHTVVETESTSKWPMAMALAGVAADGSFGPMGLDTLASEHLPFWTKDKVLVPLRSLLLRLLPALLLTAFFCSPTRAGT